MASYPKIWTSIEAEDWYQRADCLTRGMIFQLILWCKKDGDTGHLEFRSWRYLAERAGVHHSTIKKIIVQLSKSKQICRESAADLARVDFIQVKERADGTIHLFIPKYLKSQQAKTSDDLKKKTQEQPITGGICREFSLKPNRIEPNRTEAKHTDGCAAEPEREPIQAIVDKFNSICRDLPKVSKATEPRLKRLMKLRKENPDDGFWDGLFARVHASDFLCGRVDGRSFVASFDWILKPANLTKILEGNYDNRTAKGAALGTDQQKSRTGATEINSRSGGLRASNPNKYANLGKRGKTGLAGNGGTGIAEGPERKEPE